MYGDHGGDWVDERAKCVPTPGSASEHRLRAEEEWLRLHNACEAALAVRVFRLAGIYGPGRSALDTVRRSLISGGSILVTPSRHRGEAALAEAVAIARRSEGAGLRHVNRIHVDDICDALLASMTLSGEPHPKPRVFNIADNEPASRAEVMAYAAGLLGATNQDAMAATHWGSDGARGRRRASEHKRVDNTRMRAELLPHGLRYPTYREGLRGILT